MRLDLMQGTNLAAGSSERTRESHEGQQANLMCDDQKQERKGASSRAI